MRLEEVLKPYSSNDKRLYTEKLFFNSFWGYEISLNEGLDVGKSSVSTYVVENAFNDFFYGIEEWDICCTR